MPVKVLTLFGEEWIDDPKPAPAAAPNPVAPVPEASVEEPEAPGEALSEAEPQAPEPKEKKPRKPYVLKRTKHEVDPATLQYQSIGAVAALFNANTSLIRFWTKEFGIKVRTTQKGTRLYTQEQIALFRQIFHLMQERGLTLSAAKEHLKTGRKAPDEELDLRASLKNLRSGLVALRAVLKNES